MTERPIDEGSEVEERRSHALVDLLALSDRLGGATPSEIPTVRPIDHGEALDLLAAAPEDEIPLSMRLDLLHGLAGKDFPAYEDHEAGYLRLAGSIGGPFGIDAGALLTDLKRSASGEVAFAQTPTGAALPHTITAFTGEDVCVTRRVDVGGLSATWIYSELETDAPFQQAAGWVDPRSWPKRGPLLFKQMALVGSPQPIPIQALGNEHWHGVFHEEVQLVRRLNTLLHCDYWEDDRVAGMTYQLDLSLDGEINVDRGFLLVEDVGQVRRVKALKVVGFSDPGWDSVAALVCPLWTDWVRGAVEGGSTSTPIPPSGAPGAPLPGTELVGAWLDFLTDSAREYLDLFGQVADRATSGSYRAGDLRSDATTYWSKVAKDWARAWKYGWEMLEDVSEEGLDANLMPPGAGEKRGVAAAVAAGAAAGPDSTTIPLPGLDEAADLSCTRLVTIEAGGAGIDPGALTLTRLSLPDGRPAVRVASTAGDAAPGLYVGDLVDGSGQKIAPVRLYVSRVTSGGNR